MKKQFSIDRLIIENGCVKIPSGNDVEFFAACMQLINLAKAGCTFNGDIIIMRSELRENQ